MTFCLLHLEGGNLVQLATDRGIILVRGVTLGTSHRPMACLTKLSSKPFRTEMKIFSHRKAKQHCSVLFSGLVKMPPGSDKTATTAASSLISLTPVRFWVTSFLAFVTTQSALIGSWIPRLAKKRFSTVEWTQKFITPPEYRNYFLSLNGCQGSAFAEHSDFITKVSFNLLHTNPCEC